ncbi:MAG: DNA gyrase inhibitor YacG [Hyphomicrobium sp.]|nr:DNA gyrase inhibitor YacG [Hyphomicrobium sp.]
MRMNDQTAGGRCPTCRKPTVPQHRPFCSKRCADVDLARWLGGTFVIPGAALDVADDTGVALREQGSGDRRRADADDD